MVTEVGEWEERELDEGSQKVQTSGSKVSTGDVMYNMIKIINTAVHHEWKLRFLIKSKNFFSVSLMLYLYEMMDVH